MSLQQPRRLFLKALVSVLSIPALWLMNALARRAEALPEAAERMLTVRYTPEHGIKFCDKAIVVSTASGISVFSSACPHLGCRINRVQGQEIICPCHGSRFNAKGEVLHGPAAHGLRPLRYEYDRQAAVLRIFLNPACT